MLGAIFVFVTHVEIFKAILNQPHLNLAELIKYGHQSLNMFFVLSGFLITYLMLKEHRQAGKIDIRNFYARRILRVWPLYYLIVAIAFLIGPHLDSNLGSSFFDNCRAGVFKHLGAELALYGLILPNIALTCLPFLFSCAATWTVGVEEQFYIVWPLLFRCVQSRPWLMTPISILIKGGLLFVLTWLSPYNPVSSRIPLTPSALAICFLKHFDIEGLAVGALAAYLLVMRRESKLVRFLLHPVARLGIIVPVLIGSLLLPQQIYFRSMNGGIIDFGTADCIIAITYGWACIILASSTSPPKSLLSKALNYGGTITYGFYLFHIPMILAMVQIAFRLPKVWHNEILFNCFLYPSTFVATLIVSSLSYHLYESKFLKLKKFFPAARAVGETSGHLRQKAKDHQLKKLMA